MPNEFALLMQENVQLNDQIDQALSTEVDENGKVDAELWK